MSRTTGQVGPRTDESAISFRWCHDDEDWRAAQQQTHFQPRDQPPLPAACLVMDHDKPIGGIWRAVEQFEETDLGLRILLKSDQAWLFSAQVAKSHRRRGVYHRLLSHLLTGSSPYRHYLSINPTNRASLAAHRTYIERHLGSCLSIRLWSLSTTWVTGDLRVDRHLSTRRAEPIELMLGKGDR